MSSDELQQNENLTKKQKKDEKQISHLKRQAKKLLNNVDKNNKDQHGIRVQRLNKVLKKFMKIYEEELSDFYDIFQQLDDGGDIETSGIENKEIRKRLEKIFKLLKIENVGSKKEPRFKKPNKSIHLYDYVKDQIEKMLSPSSSLSKTSSIEVQKSEEQIDKQITIQNLEPPLIKKYGVTLPQNPTTTDIQGTDQGQLKQGNEDEMEKFLNTEFSSSHKNKLTSFLNQRITTNPQLAELQALQRVKKNPLVSAEVVYLGGKLEDKQSQEELQLYMRKWDEENRGSSLMALHQQKRREEKQQKMKDEPQINQRKPFDRDTDLGLTKQDSKSIMKELKQGGNALCTKFSSGNVLNSFI